MNARAPFLPAALVLAAFALAACSAATPPAGPAPTSMPTVAPAATSAPAPTSMPTATPATTSAPAPTSMPTAAPATTSAAAPTSMPAPTEAPPPTSALARDVPWILLNGMLYSDDETLVFEQRGLPVPAGIAQAAPAGTYLAYTSKDGQLVVIDSNRFIRQIDAGEIAGLVLGWAFAPDSRTLAMTVLDEQSNQWSLQIRDLSSRTTRVLQHGSINAATAGDPLPLIPRPVAWAPNGLFTEYLLWATDAPARNITLLNPNDGSARLLHEGDHLYAVPAPDGARVALVAGSPGMGEPPTMSISLLDLGGGAARVLVPEQPGFVRQLRWSPGGSRLVYAQSSDYQAPAVSLHMIDADGSGGQALALGAAGSKLRYADVAWRDATTLLLLSPEAAYVHLYALQADQLESGVVQLLFAFKNQASGPGQIVYTPRGP